MSFERDYINILERPLEVPSIHVSEEEGSNCKFGQGQSAENSVFNSVVTRLLGVNWFCIYTVPSLKSSSKKEDDLFFNKFTESFQADAIVIDHIEDIIDNELRSGILDPRYIQQRRTQLNEWLRDYYLHKILEYANVTKTTRDDYRIYLKIAYIVFSIVLPRIFKDGIWIHKETFAKFKMAIEANENKNSVLLLPNHRSHVDYIILHYLYVRFQLETPTVIAGENLNVPFFGPILRKLGAVFIKRKFNSHHDFYYVDMMKHLMQFKALKENKPKGGTELFIEGGRSRNGKPMHPKTGFLNIINESMKDGELILVQPISFVYEKPYEFNEYLIELNGLDKKQESFLSILKAGANVVWGKTPNYGKLIVNFNKEMVQFKVGDDTNALGEAVLRNIHDTSYITEISVLCLSLLLLFYQDMKAPVFKNGLIPVFKKIVSLLKEKISGEFNEELDSLVTQSNKDIISTFDSLLLKFLHEDVIVTLDTYIIIGEISLVYYKNSLLNLFINDIFHAKAQGSIKRLNILKSLFRYEFITSLIQNENTQTPNPLFKDLLNPFLESYEIALEKLDGIISISLKEWFHLLYMSPQRPFYRESLNKSNLLNAVYIFQSFGLIMKNKANEIVVIDDDGIRKFRDYLRALRVSNNYSLDVDTFEDWELFNKSNFGGQKSKL